MKHEPDEFVMDQAEYQRILSDSVPFTLPTYSSRSAEKLRRRLGETQLLYTRADLKFMLGCGIKAD